MAMRDLVMGGGACVVPGSHGAPSSWNARGGLAESLLGGASKTQERIRELPGLAGPGHQTDIGGRPLTSLPGSEFENEFDQRVSAQGSQFLRSFGRIDEGGFADAWGDAVRANGAGWLPHKESPTDKGRLIRREGFKRKQELRSSVVARAIPSGVTAAATLLTIGGALYALLQLNKDKVEAWQSQKQCETCAGSGLCPSCNGEGFLLRNLSEEAAARARKNAKDAATRYTAGLAKKWSYCTTCQGARGCPTCQGRGSIE